MKISQIFRERDPTRGSIFKESLIMTSYLWPNTLFWILIHVLNLFWLSRIGIEAIAAVALGSAAFMLLMTPIQGIVTSARTLVGIRSSEDPARLEKQVKQILSTTWLTSFILAVVGYFLAPSLLQLLGAKSEIISEAVVYLQIQAVGGIIAFSFWPINGMIRAIGRMGHGMILMALVLGIQGLLDYSLILGNFGFSEMGVAGASLSRAISGGVGAIFGFWWLCRLIKLNLKNLIDFKINLSALKEIVRIAGFDTIQGFCRQGTQMIMLAIVAPFGTLALGAYEIGHRFFRYSQMFIIDIGQTTQFGCAKILGTKNTERMRKWAWTNVGISAGLMGTTGLILFSFAPQLVEIFRQEPEIVNIGTSYFRITTLFGIGYIFFAIGIILQRAFAAAKDTLTPMVVYIVMMGLQIGLAIGLSQWLGINGVWWAILVGMVFYGLVLAFLFKTRWQSKQIDKNIDYVGSYDEA